MVGENPNAPEWRDAYHYKVVLRCRNCGQRKQLTTYFSMGYAHCREPEVGEVLNCLASDIDGTSFEEWCAEYGYDSDSRKAHALWTTCRKQADKLQTFLGCEAFQELLYDTERM